MTLPYFFLPGVNPSPSVSSSVLQMDPFFAGQEKLSFIKSKITFHVGPGSWIYINEGKWLLREQIIRALNLRISNCYLDINLFSRTDWWMHWRSKYQQSKISSGSIMKSDSKEEFCFANFDIPFLKILIKEWGNQIPSWAEILFRP